MTLIIIIIFVAVVAAFAWYLFSGHKKRVAGSVVSFAPANPMGERVAHGSDAAFNNPPQGHPAPVAMTATPPQSIVGGQRLSARPSSSVDSSSSSMMPDIEVSSDADAEMRHRFGG